MRAHKQVRRFLVLTAEAGRGSEDHERATKALAQQLADEVAQRTKAEGSSAAAELRASVAEAETKTRPPPKSGWIGTGFQKPNLGLTFVFIHRVGDFHFQGFLIPNFFAT